MNIVKVKLFSVFSSDLAHNCHQWKQDEPWWFSRIEVRGQDHNKHDRGQTVQPIFQFWCSDTSMKSNFLGVEAGLINNM